jgi:EpsI family protein
MKMDVPQMQRSRLSRREFVTGLLMAGGAGVALARTPDVALNYLGSHTLEQAIPAKIGRWSFVTNSGLVIPPKDQLALAIYSQLLTRVYADETSAIMLLVAYSANQTGFLQVHRPEFCYTAAGYQLSNFAPHDIALSGANQLRVNSLDATRDGQLEKLLYWTRIGDRIPLSWMQQKLTVAEQNLQRIIPDAALIRVSTITSDGDQALGIMDDFVRAMLESVPSSLRRVFVA